MWFGFIRICKEGTMAEFRSRWLDYSPDTHCYGTDTTDTSPSGSTVSAIVEHREAVIDVAAAERDALYAALSASYARNDWNAPASYAERGRLLTLLCPRLAAQGCFRYASLVKEQAA